MRNLKAPSIDPHEILDNVIAKKQGKRLERLNSLSSRLHNYFNEYEASKFSLEHLEEKIWKELEKEDLHYCYKKGGKALDELKCKIQETQDDGLRSSCPYCLLNTISSFDHYLPKEMFPEYSVYGFNLMPCCSLCNEKKSCKFLESGKRQFINLYYDNIPTENFLHVNIAIRNDTPVIAYYLDSSVSDLIREHFKKLDLLTRYAESAYTVISEVKNTLYVFRSNSLEEARDFMRKIVMRDELMYSKNYWKVVLYEGLLAKSSILQDLYNSLNADF
jgi:hypothetical protein